MRFAELIERVQAGDPQALAAMYAAYGAFVRGAVRRRLPHRLRKEFDSIDFAHDVWLSLCHCDFERYQFATPGELQGFLATVARNKVMDVCRRRIMGRVHNVTRERQLAHEPDTDDDRDRDNIALSRDPTPSQLAVADERWQEIAAALPPFQLTIVERIREGFSHEEVAVMAGITDRTVRRIVARVQRLCEGKP